MPPAENSRKALDSQARSEDLPSLVADPLLALRGSDRARWSDEPADAYVQRLREGQP